ncbi:MAG: NADH-ubiquinone oxidoreductase-F iron-sulfur binding region domain-containing protein [Actinomycetota bacterium]|nr:NADH-ubiquinone oxidoreductase-F iron-sulfur binding region domain-containing protein [Actinomycetota bacterium]
MPLVERVLDAVPCESLEDHVARGGGRGLDAARRLGPEAVIDEVHSSGLRGRGGAGFPTGAKWRTVAFSASSITPTAVVVNAAEGEPGTFKDREILRRNPYRVLEGAIIAASVVGASEIVVGVKSSFTREIDAVRRAIDEIEVAGWCDGRTIRIVVGPSAYLFGEETALLEVIEGRQPFPRVAPPYRRGLGDEEVGHSASAVPLATESGQSAGAPAIVDNVETLANVPLVLAEGADWFRSVGTEQSPGTQVCTITGDTVRDGVAEVAMGTTLAELIEIAGGGMPGGRTVGAVLSGVSNPLITADELGTELSYEGMRAVGGGLGTGGFLVFDDRSDPVAIAHGVARFLSVESCGQCTPCKQDGLELASHLERLRDSNGGDRDLRAVERLTESVSIGARCYIGIQQEQVIGSLLARFPSALAGHADGTIRAAAPVVIAPIVDIRNGRAVLDPAQATKNPDWSHGPDGSDRVPVEYLAGTPVEVTIGEGPAVVGGSADAVTTAGSRRADDPLGPVLDAHRDVLADLDELPRLDPAARPVAVDGLRERLRVHADVTQRIVEPVVRRRGGDDGENAADAASEHEEAAVDLIDRLAAVSDGDVIPDDEVERLVSEIRGHLTSTERILTPLVEAELDEADRSRLAAAVEEARQLAEAGR